MKQDLGIKIREVLDQRGQLALPAARIGDYDDLYAAGLKSFATVQVMLALEGLFNVEFPDDMLTRNTFSSIHNIGEGVSLLKLSEGA